MVGESGTSVLLCFLFILMVPNIVLCFTEPLSFIAKVCNVLLTFWMLLPANDTIQKLR